MQKPLRRETRGFLPAEISPQAGVILAPDCLSRVRQFRTRREMGCSGCRRSGRAWCRVPGGGCRSRRRHRGRGRRRGRLGQLRRVRRSSTHPTRRGLWCGCVRTRHRDRVRAGCLALRPLLAHVHWHTRRSGSQAAQSADGRAGRVGPSRGDVGCQPPGRACPGPVSQPPSCSPGGGGYPSPMRQGSGGWSPPRVSQVSPVSERGSCPSPLMIPLVSRTAGSARP